MASGRGILRRLEAEKGNPAPMVQPPCALRDGGLREARGEPLGAPTNYPSRGSLGPTMKQAPE